MPRSKANPKSAVKTTVIIAGVSSDHRNPSAEFL
jgi:hypothetical protein